jgi:hypothetical protein
VTSDERLEFWPDYAGALLHRAGKSVLLDDLPLPADLVERATAWVGRYDDSKLPFGDSPDPGWLTEGRAIFAALRASLATAGVALEDWEGIWTG